MKTKIKIKNLTPHPINILDEGGKCLRTFASEGAIRLATTIIVKSSIAGIPTSKTVFGDPEGLPDFKEGQYYIVSQLIKSALPGRVDLLVPAEVMRDETGQIIGCKSLGR